MNKTIALIFSFIFLVLFLSACGGSGGGSGKEGGDPNSDTSWETIAVDDDARSAIMEDSSLEYDAIISDSSLSAEEISQEMVDYLNTIPEIEAAGVSDDGCAWGRFTDDRLVIFVNNRTPDPDQSSDSVSSKVRAATFSPPSNLPEGTVSRIGDNLGGDYGDPYSPITEWLETAGYAPSLPGDLIDMTSMGSLGLFVINSHGGSGTWRDGSKAYAIWASAFDIAPNKDDAFKNELDDRRLCYMYADKGWGPEGDKHQWRYAFTAKYVMEYMNFTKGSFVFIDACSSDEPVMRAAFLAKGASVYAGWSSPVDSGKAKIAASYLFDRLLGANKYDPESPKQRPFDWQSVYSWMQDNGYDIGQDAGGCYLKMTPHSDEGNGFGLLAPSLQFVSAQTTDKGEELYLYGLFGDDPGSDGKVTVGGDPLQVKEWKRDTKTTNLDLIICDLPSESYGDVKVTVRKHESNIRHLSLYDGDIKLTHDTGDGRKYEITHHLSFRADLQSARLKPGDQPVYSPMNPQYVFADVPSTADLEASGATIFPDGSMVEWSGDLTLANNIDGESNQDSFLASIKFDPAAKKAQLGLSGGFSITQILMETAMPWIISYGKDVFDGINTYSTSYVEFTLDNNFNLPKVERQSTKATPSYSMISYNLDTVAVTFDSISCQSPPLDTDAR
ncbi:MAG: hypothetical protein KJ737_04290 [Proteobacteria bacterium]|nr:hypothetical protein [Pseudomonadota bacterium]